MMWMNDVIKTSIEAVPQEGELGDTRSEECCKLCSRPEPAPLHTMPPPPAGANTVPGDAGNLAEAMAGAPFPHPYPDTPPTGANIVPTGALMIVPCPVHSIQASKQAQGTPSKARHPRGTPWKPHGTHVARH